jgi:hypothetical protein
VDHSGANFGYRADILHFPEQRFSVLCLCNLSSAQVTNLPRKVADVYLEKVCRMKQAWANRQAPATFLIRVGLPVSTWIRASILYIRSLLRKAI